MHSQMGEGETRIKFRVRLTFRLELFCFFTLQCIVSQELLIIYLKKSIDFKILLLISVYYHVSYACAK